MDYIKKFIEHNRQTGTSTALILLALLTKGCLIVADHNIKHRRLKLYPNLNILTLSEIKRGMPAGLSKSPIFFDTDAVFAISSQSSEEFQLDEENQILNKEDLKDLHDVIYKAKQDPDFKIITNKGFETSNKKEEQLNIKLTFEDLNSLNKVKSEIFDNEISLSSLGRILLKKGLNFYTKLESI